MKKLAYLAAAALLLCLTACGAPGGAAAATPAPSTPAPQTPENSKPPEPQKPQSQVPEPDEEEIMKITVTSDEYEIVYELNDSQAAKDLYAQLPLTTEVEPFSNNEMTFYPAEKLNTANTPLSGGAAGSLSYYTPWGDVVMFYAPCAPNGSLYELGTAVCGAEHIAKLAGQITVSVCA